MDSNKQEPEVELITEKAKIPRPKHDYIMKFLVGQHPKEFLSFFGLDYEFIGFLPTENVDLLQAGFRLDSLLAVLDKSNDKLNEGIPKGINFEFQTNEADNNALKRIALYSLLSDVSFGMDIISVIVNLKDVEEGDISIRLNSSITFDYKSRSLKSIEALSKTLVKISFSIFCAKNF